jgi:hypothetical protein
VDLGSGRTRARCASARRPGSKSTEGELMPSWGPVSQRALRDLVSAECLRLGLPKPMVESRNLRGVPGRGLMGGLRLTFGQSVSGPLLLGRTRYFGGGLFRPIEGPDQP